MDSRQIFDSYVSWTFSHANREANMTAHQLANDVGVGRFSRFPTPADLCSDSDYIGVGVMEIKVRNQSGFH